MKLYRDMTEEERLVVDASLRNDYKKLQATSQGFYLWYDNISAQDRAKVREWMEQNGG